MSHEKEMQPLRPNSRATLSQKPCLSQSLPSSAFFHHHYTPACQDRKWGPLSKIMYNHFLYFLFLQSQPRPRPLESGLCPCFPRGFTHPKISSDLHATEFSEHFLPILLAFHTVSIGFSKHCLSVHSHTLCSSGFPAFAWIT